MLGLMQDRPLTLTHVFHRAEQLFGYKTLVFAKRSSGSTSSGHPSPELINARHTSMMSTTPRSPASPSTGR